MKRWMPLVLMTLALVSGCIVPPSPTPAASVTPTALPPTPTETPIPTPEMPRTLVVCLAEEPQTLYPYGGNSRSMWAVLEALYDGPFDTRQYGVQPVILEKMPALSDGDARIEAVEVRAGDPVVDAAGNLVALAAGVQVLPAGCASPECAVTWDGSSSLQMDRLTVTFRLKEGIQWSDGAPLTAEDSVFSFNIAADPATPTAKGLIDRTLSYTALDERTVEWVGVPGFLERNYPAYFFLPLPRHAWGTLSAAQILQDEQIRRAPLGWGAYTVQEWTAGDHITLKKNPLYFRAAEGLPAFDTLVFRFSGNPPDSALMALVAGECDIVEPNADFLPLLEELINTQNNGRLQLLLAQGPEWEHVAFGIRPASYDDGYDPAAGDRPDFFGDVRTRQAFALCANREAIVRQVFFNRVEVPRGYLAPDHPAYNKEALPEYPYDPARGSALLDEVGWKDLDNDPGTPRVAQGVSGVPDGTPLKVELLTTQAALRTQTAQTLQQSWRACGIETTIAQLPPGEMFAPGPDGAVFGRRFDLAMFYWQTSQRNACALYTSAQIPGAINQWIGVNVSGFSSPAYDAACLDSLRAHATPAEDLQALQNAEKVFAEQLPVLPLYFQLKIAIARPDLCGFALDPTARSFLWNIEDIHIGEGCQP
ncbi:MULTISPECIES: peptide ABC transporter substrate-binding protein [Anaerolinea]|uniref:peptide ABC transporter substrate-binding protein n=1 Tax=Anaerolinea TaxID=233189 RepID=UPI0026227EDA|nr:peptide ABC transporter substrate-binding protein [Anaerolinea thermophila]